MQFAIALGYYVYKNWPGKIAPAAAPPPAEGAGTNPDRVSMIYTPIGEHRSDFEAGDRSDREEWDI